MRPTIEPPASTWFPPPPSRTRTRRSTSLGGYSAVYARAFAPNGPVLYWDHWDRGDLRLLLQELYDQAPMSNTESSHVQHRPELET